jgi:hypothetical protein
MEKLKKKNSAMSKTPIVSSISKTLVILGRGGRASKEGAFVSK